MGKTRQLKSLVKRHEKSATNRINKLRHLDIVRFGIRRGGGGTNKQTTTKEF